MLRIFADALMLFTRQNPMPRPTNRRAANPDVEAALARRDARLNGLGL